MHTYIIEQKTLSICVSFASILFVMGVSAAIFSFWKKEVISTQETCINLSIFRSGQQIQSQPDLII